MTDGARAISVQIGMRSVVLLAWLAACGGQEMKLLSGGDSHDLRNRKTGAQSSAKHPGILIVALDGVDRELLYDAIKSGQMPALANLLGPSAYFDESITATLPSTTMAGWATAFTGVAPAYHGITGNEFFVRETTRFEAPAPASFSDHDVVLSSYTDQYLNRLCLAPTVYQRMRQEDPNVLIWVAMQQLYSGADRFLLTKPTMVLEAFAAYFDELAAQATAQRESRSVYEKLDKNAMDVLVSALDDKEAKTVPDVLTVYLAGTDLYAHVAKEGPDAARRAYLHEVVDGQIGLLAAKLRSRGALEDRYVVVTSDHGHTEVVHDDVHALGGSPAILLKKAGLRPRAFKLEVPKDDDFQAVLAYQGALAYVYLADRSTCPLETNVCDWTRPPRFTEDVLTVADAFYTNNESGAFAPALKGALDMVLTRHPRPYAEDDLPFEVYVGAGKLVPVDQYLAAHPHPTYVDFAARLRELAVGPHGERAGDVLLVAHNGDRAATADRYYFAPPYHSWHGSPSKKDSELPLIVAREGAKADAIRAFVQHAIGEHPHQQKITDLLLALRRLPAHL